jgi:VanZ family protein
MQQLPGENIPHLDKMLHAVLFGTFTFLLAEYFRGNRHFGMNTRWILVLAATLSFFYGLVIESLQYLIPERSFELLDVLANFIGICIGILIFLIKFYHLTDKSFINIFVTLILVPLI